MIKLNDRNRTILAPRRIMALWKSYQPENTVVGIKLEEEWQVCIQLDGRAAALVLGYVFEDDREKDYARLEAATMYGDETAQPVN